MSRGHSVPSTSLNPCTWADLILAALGMCNVRLAPTQLWSSWTSHAPAMPVNKYALTFILIHSSAMLMLRSTKAWTPSRNIFCSTRGSGLRSCRRDQHQGFLQITLKICSSPWKGSRTVLSLCDAYQRHQNSPFRSILRAYARSLALLLSSY